MQKLKSVWRRLSTRVVNKKTCRSSEPIAFMHVPKTSGIALTSGLLSALAPSRPLSRLDAVLFGGFADFDSMSAEIRRTIFLDPALLPANCDFIAGHISFATLRFRYPGARFITFLREARSRLLSHWLYGRSQTDEFLAGWGTWGDTVRKFRLLLEEFLRCTEVASLIDKLALRMLVFPHRMVPKSGFIEQQHDDLLIHEALNQLKRFSHVDYVENHQLQPNFSAWLGRQCSYPRVNEIPDIPTELKCRLDRELTDESYELLNVRSRLDMRLWRGTVSSRHPPGENPPTAEQILLTNVARYSRIMG